jgi:putative MATE family efflux protein
MTTMTAARIEKEHARRKWMLEGNMWSIVATISLPLILYNSIAQFFGFFDTLIASNLSPSIVSAVSFNSQIQSVFTSVASGLSIGGGIMIARYFGAGDDGEVKKNVNTLFFLSIATAIVMVAAIIPFTTGILRLLSMPEDLIPMSALPFRIDTACLLPFFVNSIWYSIEKSKGNTKVILWCNLALIVMKFSLTLFFVYVLGKGMAYLSLATLIANSAITVVALISLFARDNPYRISLRHVSLSSKTLGRILSLSVPVFFERFAFNYGKVAVNSMCAAWGSTVIGALGVSNRLGGFATTPPNGVQEAEAALVSQSLGAGDYRRAEGMFFRSLAYNFALGVIFYVLMLVFKDNLIALFARGNPQFAEEIGKIFVFERNAAIPVALGTAAMGFLYGCGYTKTVMVINMLRLFLFRIPPLWYIQTYTDMGSEGVGLAMLISNDLFGVTTVAASVVVMFMMRAQWHSTGRPIA